MRRRKKRVPLKTEEQTAEEQEQPTKPVRKAKARKVIKPELPAETLTRETTTVSEEAAATAAMVAPVVESRGKAKKRRKPEISAKVCSVEVCLPEICCADMEGELSFSTNNANDVPPGPPFFRLSMRRSYRSVTSDGQVPVSHSRITRSVRSPAHDPIMPGHFFPLRGSTRATITALRNLYEAGLRERRARRARNITAADCDKRDRGEKRSGRK